MSNREKNKLVKVVSAESQDDPIAERARRLTEIATLMDATNDFHKGQLVRWKPGLRNRLLPGYNEPAIIREVLPAPVYDSCERARCAKCNRKPPARGLSSTCHGLAAMQYRNSSA